LISSRPPCELGITVTLTPQLSINNSYALIFVPGTGVLEGYAGAAASQTHNAVAFFLMAWFIFTFVSFSEKDTSSS